MPASRSVVSVLLRSCEEPPLLTYKRPNADEGRARTCRDAQTQLAARHGWAGAVVCGSWQRYGCWVTPTAM
jgi:hypothetical protein